MQNYTMTASLLYTGDLRCEVTHLQSGTVIETDAPTDNRGKGEKFSPTDILCVSLATCVLTTMALKAIELKIDLKNTKVDITKHMLKDPRRVSQIDITMHFPGLGLTTEQKSTFEFIGNNCPVAKSLSPEVKQNIKFIWQD
jgi:uncharacterized OsmC-like protein